MSEEQDNQIERRDSAGINRRSETARRGSDAAGFVAKLTKRESPGERPTARNLDLSVPYLQSEFEDNVERALLSRGYRADRQVRLIRYKVSLAIISKDGQGYDLGILCHGVRYYQTDQAIDARITKALEEEGWNIIDIESKDWFLNPEGELENLLTVLNKIRLEI
jgi:very-short-patch-repair endonuclease